MRYFTSYAKYSPTEPPSETQKFFDELYDVQSDIPKYEYTPGFFRTYTRILNMDTMRHVPITGSKSIAMRAITSNDFMYGRQNLDGMYDIFHIPKRSGGLRTISAPKPELMALQKDILNWMAFTVKLLPHDCAFAYVQHRSVKDVLIRHQRNGSRWFLKLDIKDFFPSMNPDFVLSQLMRNGAVSGPFEPGRASWTRRRDQWKSILEPCFLNNGLPQGAPTSPLLSNIVMVPIDFTLAGQLWNFNKHHFIYTRYADDILISCKEKFNPQEVVTLVEKTLEDTPLRLNLKKTRFGSSAGANWNLGMMYNAKGDITLGHKRKARFRSMLHNFMMDFKNNQPWSIEDTRKLDGEQAWFRTVEPDWTKRILRTYETEYAGVPYRAMVKAILNP